MPVPRLSLSLSLSTTTATPATSATEKDKEKDKDGKEKDKYALTEAEKADKWDDLLLMSERAGGTLRVGVGLGY